MTMNPLDPFGYGKALAESWAAAGKAFLSAQEDTGRVFAEGMRAAITAPTFPELSGGMTELARANQAWTALWSEAGIVSAVLSSKLPAAAVAADEPSPTVDATLRKMVDPRLWLAGGGEMDEALNRMSEGPRLADLWDVERRYARVMRAWLDVRRGALEHGAVVLEGWLRAGRSFADELAKRPQDPDHKTPDAKALLALWTETANRVLLEMQRSERFLATQTASIRASTELRTAQRDLVEYYGEQFGFPTRTELDDVHRTVTELRRELRRALKRRDGQAADPATTARPGSSALARGSKASRTSPAAVRQTGG